MSAGPPEGWVEVGAEAEIERRRRVVVAAEPDDVVVWWHDGCPRALRNVCVHDGRLLADGSLLGRRVVCPGHQWAFDLETGYCQERDRYQPVFPTRVDGGLVYVRLAPADESPAAADRD